MPLPEPEPGLVVRYDFLWAREAAEGRAYGKDRPTCIVAASSSTTRPRYVVLLPITHAPPREGTVAIEIPPRAKAAIGLDEERAWVVVSDHNVDHWPNGGLSPRPGTVDGFSYGFLPPTLFATIRGRFLELLKEKATRAVHR